MTQVVFGLLLALVVIGVGVATAFIDRVAEWMYATTAKDFLVAREAKYNKYTKRIMVTLLSSLYLVVAAIVVLVIPTAIIFRLITLIPAPRFPSYFRFALPIIFLLGLLLGGGLRRGSGTQKTE
jgi:hypothetical protein